MIDNKIPYKMTLEEALKNVEEAKEIGYLNRYPVSCIVLAEALEKANIKIKRYKEKAIKWQAISNSQKARI